MVLGTIVGEDEDSTDGKVDGIADADIDTGR